MKLRTLFTMLTILILGLGVMPLAAQCTPDPAVNGDTVTCTGTDTNGFDGSGQTSLTVNVNGGANVQTGAEDGIRTGGQATIDNNGSVTGGDDAISAAGSSSVTR